MNKNKSKMTIGLDPELMLFNKKKGKIVSAIPVIKHDKEDRLELGDGYSVFYDNVLLETNIIPSNTKDGLINNIKDGFSRISKVIGSDYNLVVKPSHWYDESECQHEDARLFGCSEEFCAYELDSVPAPICENTFRSGGGHIHLGRSDFKDFEVSDSDGDRWIDGDGIPLLDSWSKISTIKLMDLLVGVPFVLLDNSEDSLDRKKLYGKAGRHRTTPYGVEYRTLSNFWISSPKYAELVFDLTENVFNSVMNGNVDSILERQDPGLISHIINTNNVELANKAIYDIGLSADLIDKIKNLIDYKPLDLKSEWGIK